MFQDSIRFKDDEMRRARRHALPSRTYLALGVAATEGIVAAAVVWAAQWTFEAEQSQTLSFALHALGAGALYFMMGMRAARQLASASSAPRYHLLGAALSLLIALAASASLVSNWVQPSFAPPGWKVYALSIAWLLLFRIALRRRVADMINAGRFQMERVALLGRAHFLKKLERDNPLWRSGAQVIATLHLGPDMARSLGEIEDFIALCVQRRCDTLLLVGEMGELPQIEHLLRASEAFAIDILFAPAHTSVTQAPILLDTRPYGPMRSVRVKSKPLDDLALTVKRMFDVAASCIGLLTLWPLLLLIAVAIRISSPGPALYRQRRRGFNGETFVIYKFRTMTVMESSHSVVPACPNDARITPIGRLLRRTSLDELPQLMNVLLGQMSLVGPRPHAVSHDAELGKRAASYARRQRMKPGITGWAQVNGHRGDVSTPERLEARTLHDLYYIENWSLGLDITILFFTLFSAKTRQNAE